MPSTGGSNYDTATNTFRPAANKPLPLPNLKNRKPRLNYTGKVPLARPFVQDPKGPTAGLPSQGVQYPKGVSNGVY